MKFEVSQLLQIKTQGNTTLRPKHSEICDPVRWLARENHCPMTSRRRAKFDPLCSCKVSRSSQDDLDSGKEIYKKCV